MWADDKQKTHTVYQTWLPGPESEYTGLVRPAHLVAHSHQEGVGCAPVK